MSDGNGDAAVDVAVERGVKRSLFSEIEPPKEAPDWSKPALPAVELLSGGAVRIVREPKGREHHLCLGCTHFFETVRVQDSLQPTGHTHAAWESSCLVQRELDLSSETVLRCTHFAKGAPGAAVGLPKRQGTARWTLWAIALVSTGALGWAMWTFLQGFQG